MDGVSPHPDKPGISRGPKDGATQGEPAGTPRLGFAFDYVDPGSYLAAELLYRRMSSGLEVQIDWRPLELRPPPTRPLDASNPTWVELTRGVAQQALREGIEMVEPKAVPWTRKAHELASWARENGRFDAVHKALFAAHFRNARDIGRIDVLVEIGEEHGLEAAMTRTVLGTDRFSAAVAASSESLRSWGVRGVPTLQATRGLLEGLQSVASLDSFLTGVEADASGEDTSDGQEKWPDT